MLVLVLVLVLVPVLQQTRFFNKTVMFSDRYAQMNGCPASLDQVKFFCDWLSRQEELYLEIGTQCTLVSPRQVNLGNLITSLLCLVDGHERDRPSRPCSRESSDCSHSEVFPGTAYPLCQMWTRQHRVAFIVSMQQNKWQGADSQSAVATLWCEAGEKQIGCHVPSDSCP